MLWHFDELSEFARSGHGGFNATSDRGHSRRNRRNWDGLSSSAPWAMIG